MPILSDYDIIGLNLSTYNRFYVCVYNSYYMCSGTQIESNKDELRVGRRLVRYWASEGEKG